MNKNYNSKASPGSGLIGWFVHNHVAANILMLLFVVGGLFAISQMRTETFPSIDPRIISVSVVYPGATPYEVADGITSRVEESLLGTDGVKRISSTATEGYGVVTVELKDFTNADDVYNDVETAVNSLSDFPPEDAERPKIVKARITPNVMSLALYGDAPETTLKYWAETIEDELRQLDGVALTSLRGIRDYQISIDVSEETLRDYDLTLQDIGQAVARYSVDIPAGTIETNRGDISLRIQNRSYEGPEFEKIVLRTMDDGSTVRLGDVADVVDGFEDINLESRFNGKPAAFIDVKRSESEDTLEVANAVKKYLTTVQIPSGLSLTLQQDETVNLVDRISLMMRNAILGFMLVFLVLLLFLDLKLAFWTSVAIPVSFLGGMMIIHFFGYSLNMISLFALIVVLGIVVDDAIVTGESIFNAQKKYPNDPDAVLKGVNDVLSPVMIGVSTTIAAFAPLAMSTGVMGQIISVIPIVVIPILVVSLLEAFFILPAHLSNPKKWSVGIVAQIRDVFNRGLETFSENVLIPVASFAMNWRYASLAAFVAFSIFTASLVSSGMVRFIFFPAIEGNEVVIGLTMPQGTSYDVTKQTMIEIERGVLAVREELGDNGDNSVFESISVMIGQTGGSSGSPVSSGSENIASHLGEVKIQLVPSDFRDVSSMKIEQMIREKIKDLPGIDKLEFQSSPIGEEADVELELSHPDEAVLNAAADDLKSRIEAIEGTKEVQDSFEPGKTEYVFTLSDEGYATGLTPAQLGEQLRYAFFGLEAQRFQRGRSEIIVYVRYTKAERESLTALRKMRVRLPDNTQVPLSSVATITEQTGYSQIKTVDGRQVVSVTSDVDYDVVTPNEVIELLSRDILPELKNIYPGLNYSFEGESREQAEDLASLGRNMLVALLLIYVLLGAQLRSYVQPLVIMAAIPFGVVGAIWGHIFIGQDLTFISLFGVVALAGVVVNGSVVLVDYLNKQHADGAHIQEAALKAIIRRFRPIFLTTLTTSLGLLPILMETSMQAKFLIPMVISLAAGILFATVIILFLLPCLVLVVQDIKDLPQRALHILHKERASPSGGGE